jgi:hypothetical protein
LSKSKYNDNFPTLAEGFARDGLSDKQIAKNLGIATSTFYEYQKKNPEFSEAVARGKAPVDIQVENALLKRALGYDVRERHIETDGTGSPIKQKVITKHFEPDISAIKFWLVNRLGKKWSDKQKIEAEIEDKTEQQLAETLLENMSFEEREEFLDKLLNSSVDT